VLLTSHEASRFLEDVLRMDRWWARPLQADRPEFLRQLMGAYLSRVPFQSLCALITRQVPSLEQVKQEAISRTGGLCFTMNVFFQGLLDALGFDAVFAFCTIHDRIEHGSVLVRDLTAAGELHCVDVGCGYVVPRPMLLPAAPGQTLAYRHGSLEVELTRREHGVIERHHTAAGRRSLFWVMDLDEPCGLEQVARAVRPTYEGYDRLRVVLAAGPELIMVAYKDDLLLTDDPRTGELSAHRFEDEQQRLRSLRDRLPQLNPDLVRAGLERAGWRRGDFHGRG